MMKPTDFRQATISRLDQSRNPHESQPLSGPIMEYWHGVCINVLMKTVLETADYDESTTDA